jgi:hypothetical protein
MPYSIETNAHLSGWAIRNENDGTVLGCHKTLEKAISQATALNNAEAEQTPQGATP